MEYRVLGSLEVVGVEGPLELRGAKERAVLACLLANIGRTVSPDEIVDAVWGEHPPASAVRSLHAHISKPALSLGGRESEAAGLARGRSEHALAAVTPGIAA
jgi:DNA-binding SARP family transcriptional activator